MFFFFGQVEHIHRLEDRFGLAAIEGSDGEVNDLRRRWGRSFSWGRTRPVARNVPRRWGGPRRMFKSSSSYSAAPLPKRWTPRKTRKQRKLGPRHYVLIFMTIIVLAIIECFVFFDKELRQPLVFIAKIRITQMATEAINTAIKQEIAEGTDADKLIQWKMKSDGKVSGFLIDYKEQMKVTARTVDVVDRVLKDQQNLHEKIPVGQALNSPLLSSIGPQISVSFRPATAVKVEVGTRQTNAGINMLLIEVYIHIKTEISIVIPFEQAPSELETDIPLSYALIVGDVPMYYYDNKGTPVGNGADRAPAITLPLPTASPAQ